ncbi:DUF742 domain-containing protein [Streptomyces venezuelae]|uniref:DUF742 domain-containing protein n=1 Tax=Streptomyces venezuelae TaxID=54571 RepID=A0A5P2B505_STRVZ|nr:DUF742 domain-containing protein [Streptomyces venezuelae]QES25563.1 DUF742 domain-containing protein [Streptomyces venezuelae]
MTTLRTPHPSRLAFPDARGTNETARRPTGLCHTWRRTGHRTRPRYQLAVETLVITTADEASLAEQPVRHRRIARLCREVTSVAEVSALLRLPLGTTRVLLADLTETGVVDVQPLAAQSPDGSPATPMLERVLAGLLAL